MHCERALIHDICTNMTSLVNQSATFTGAVSAPEHANRERDVAVLRNYIAAGSYGPGDRLPPERELIGQLGMTRTTLRKALDALEREGAIWRHVGKGTFVAGHGDHPAVGSVASLRQQLTPVRMVQARRCIEPAIAREAAINASQEAIIRIKLARDRAEEASSWANYEVQDDLFHRAIAEASDNILLLSLFDQLNKVCRAVAGSNVIRGTSRPPREHTSFVEHARITKAIEAREPAAAQAAMNQHIASVAARLYGEA